MDQAALFEALMREKRRREREAERVADEAARRLDADPNILSKEEAAA